MQVCKTRHAITVICRHVKLSLGPNEIRGENRELMRSLLMQISSLKRSIYDNPSYCSIPTNCIPHWNGNAQCTTLSSIHTQITPIYISSCIVLFFNLYLVHCVDIGASVTFHLLIRALSQAKDTRIFSLYLPWIKYRYIQVHIYV